MKKIFLLCLCFLFLVKSPIAFSGDVEIGGLLIDQTKTMVGHNFFRNFSILLEWPSWIKGCNITIVVSEKATARWDLIQIEVDDRIIYRKLFNRRSGEIEKEAQIAAGRAADYLNQLQQEDQQEKEIY